MLKLRTFSIFSVCLTLLCANGAVAGPFTNKNKLGDLFLSGSVFYAYGMTMHEKSWTAALQLTESIVAAQAATELLKRTVHEERPNRSDDLSFPSGHASGAFSGAMFVHKRYGWKAAIPPYIMAGVVGWSRVQARAHYWHDVLGGAAVSALFTWVLVDSENSLSVSADTSGAQLNFSFKF